MYGTQTQEFPSNVGRLITNAGLIESAVRYYLAWGSILREQEDLNLDNFQRKLAETKLKASDETVDARIPETYQWLLVPTQPDPRGDIQWEEIRQQGPDDLAIRASKKLKTEEFLLTDIVHPGSDLRSIEYLSGGETM